MKLHAVCMTKLVSYVVFAASIPTVAALSSRKLAFGINNALGLDSSDAPTDAPAVAPIERTGCALYAWGSRSAVPTPDSGNDGEFPEGGFCASLKGGASGLNNMIDNTHVQAVAFSDVTTAEECEAAAECISALEGIGEPYVYTGLVGGEYGEGETGWMSFPSGCSYMDEKEEWNGNSLGNPREVTFNNHAGDVGYVVNSQYYIICQY